MAGEGEFKRHRSGFVVIFPRAHNVGVGITPAAVATTQKLPKNYPKTTRMAFSIIAEKPTITRKELAERLGLTPDGAKYHIDKLRKDGHIRCVGGRRGGHWVVVE